MTNNQAAEAISTPAGLDALEISGGVLTGGRMGPSRMVKNEDQEAYFKNEARAFRTELNIPLILVGGLRSFETAGNY
jgi:2,4-dienoyl-CoA reductase-like NADH-dependent reductase (Old Yellow Enzyme family)